MAQNEDHRAYLAFLSRISGILAEYAVNDLEHFRSQAAGTYPAMERLIDACISLAGQQAMRRGTKEPEPSAPSGDGPPLSELLRSTELFPTTQDLVRFAQRVLPGIRGLDRKGRAVVAKKIVAHVKQINGGRRQELEASMRHAMVQLKSGQSNPQSFFGQWEKIIKGLGR